MKCWKCQNPDTKVVDSRSTNDWYAIRRRRVCEKCWFRFSTFERAWIADLIVVKKNWERESYDRDKLQKAILLAYAKRDISWEKVDDLLAQVEFKWIWMKEILSTQIGEDVLAAIKNDDPVAYIRFASVYQNFDDADDFRKILWV